MHSRAALFCLFSLIVSSQVFAQQAAIPDNPLFPNPRPMRIFIGPLVGYNSNFHSGGFLTLAGPNSANADCGSFTTGGGNGLILGLAAEYWFKPAGNTSLQLRVYYEQKPGTFQQITGPYPWFDTTNGGQLTYFENFHNVTAKYNLFNVEVMYKYDIPGLPNFGVAIGPKFGFVVGTQYHQYDSLTNGFKFTANNLDTVDVVPAQNIPGASGFRFGLKAAIQYEMLVGQFLLTPSIWYDLGVTKVTSEAPWNVSSLAGTLEIKYGF